MEGFGIVVFILDFCLYIFLGLYRIRWHMYKFLSYCYLCFLRLLDKMEYWLLGLVEAECLNVQHLLTLVEPLSGYRIV